MKYFVLLFLLLIIGCSGDTPNLNKAAAKIQLEKMRVELYVCYLKEILPNRPQTDKDKAKAGADFTICVDDIINKLEN